ncbi:hypothetical protein F5Y15DRAFT_415334 [Xylariaceae sp. FL0016]|nr:hypothetical protein F5Y15DRAFT_415334 [Xylariaceae sp. FL0016]
MAIPPDPVPRGPVRATLNFTHPPPPGETLITHVDATPTGEPRSNIRPNPQAVLITDIRGRESDFTLDRDAFQILRHQPPPSSEPSAFTDDASIREHYYPEIASLLLATVPGATRIHLFDHTVRRPHPSARRKAVQYPHIDQTPLAAAKRVRTHLGPDADALLRRRYRIINVWRPLNPRPVASLPLAFASSASLAPHDVIPVERRDPAGYVGQTAAVAYNPDQRWYYLSGMTSDERVLLECFDSEALKPGSGVQGGQVPHSAFADPRTRADAEGRESIEVRALVFGP